MSSSITVVSNKYMTGCYLLLTLVSTHAIYATENAIKINYALEIDAIISQVQASGCTFFRNGQAYSSQKAASHLRLKLNREKGKIQTTEQFIKKLASSSSITRIPYQIECHGQAKVLTNEWLFDRLHALRPVTSFALTD